MEEHIQLSSRTLYSKVITLKLEEHPQISNALCSEIIEEHNEGSTLLLFFLPLAFPSSVEWAVVGSTDLFHNNFHDAGFEINRHFAKSLISPMIIIKIL